ncbi:hypothetical protein M405DRAFT_867475 [Rhizopogon salebrosus TDB-379]|nr:hypothetical protein M405DRAFT_867475 [Rhizopogon salebrosus TDB-379]
MTLQSPQTYQAHSRQGFPPLADEFVSVEDQDLQDLAGELDQEEDMTMDDGADSDESEQSGAENDVVDEVALLTPAEQKALAESIRPIRLTLIKLHKLAYKLVHSTTLLLPAWKEKYMQRPDKTTDE